MYKIMYLISLILKLKLNFDLYLIKDFYWKDMR